METDWLEEKIEINLTAKNVPGPGPGRPRKNWEEAGERAKRGKVSDLAKNETEPLLLAAAKSAKAENNPTLSFVIKKTVDSNDNILKVKKAIATPDVIKMKTEDALALKVHSDLSDNQYQMIRNSSKLHNADIYPTLHNIFEEKKNCYPKELHITETSAKCSLKSMIDHTLKRIVHVCQDEILMENNGNDLTGIIIFFIAVCLIKNILV